MQSSNGQMRQFNILRLCILIISGPFATAAYVNGKRWALETDDTDLLIKLGGLFRGKMSITDTWKVVTISDLNSFPDYQNELAALWDEYDIPTYEGEASHGMIPQRQTETKDTEYKHVKWFVWFNEDNHMVYVGERQELANMFRGAGYASYNAVFAKAKEIGMDRGGVKCVQFSEDKFPTLQDVENKYKKADNYV